MLEAAIERKFTLECERNGILARKYTTPGVTGTPDHIYFRKARVAIIEFKQPGDTPKPRQEMEIDAYTDQDIPCTWVDNVDSARKFLMKTFKMRSWK